MAKKSGNSFDLVVSDASLINNISPTHAAFEHVTNKRVCSQTKFIETENVLQVIDTVKSSLMYDTINEKEYPSTGCDPGLIVIFNQKHFDNPMYSTRMGTVPDINALLHMFGNFGFNITKDNVHNDLTRGEILQTLKTIAAEDHSQRNCLIVIILTHGDENNALQAKDAPLYTNEVWEQFTVENCPTLKDKVKFFIFQACKGSNTSTPLTDDESISTTTPACTELVSSSFFSKPLERDMLVAFASVEGNKSYRHIYDGAWFIQEMCLSFLAYGRFDDVMSLLIKTSKCVARNYYYVSKDVDSSEAIEGSPTTVNEVIKQMPIFISTLRKRFYLNKNKDRNWLLHLVEQQRKMEEIVSKIKAEIENILN